MAPIGVNETKFYDGSELRIGIVHARWNNKIISSLLDGVKRSLKAAGVKDENVVVQTVPGSYELPYAVQRMYAASQVQSTASGSSGLLASATDLLSSASMTDLTQTAPPPTASTSSTTATTRNVGSQGLQTPFDAVVAIGCLVKGETMHFEYIAEATAHGLMRAQLDMQIPVVFGLLTVLNEEQGFMRAGVGGQSGQEGHNHGLDWGSAAVELGVKRRGWAKGEMVE